MKNGDTRMIEILGERIESVYLGCGHYAKAYRVNDDVYCFVNGDYMKEAIQDMDSTHVPKIEWVQSNGEIEVYKMPFYEPIKTSHKAAWADLRLLRKLWDEIPPVKGIAWNSDRNWELVKRLRALSKESLADAIEAIQNEIGNYGSECTFEFSRRNIGVDESGNIVLRDVCFDPRRLKWYKG